MHILEPAHLLTSAALHAMLLSIYEHLNDEDKKKLCSLPFLLIQIAQMSMFLKILQSVSYAKLSQMPVLPDRFWSRNFTER